MIKSPVLLHPVFDTVMSREAKWLRDGILELCIEYGSKAKSVNDSKQLMSSIVAVYSPISWEKAVLYASAKNIHNAMLRKTSAEYYKEDEIKIKPPWARGKANGIREKKIDWLSLAKFDSEWWFGMVQFPRDGSVQPFSIARVEEQFVPMYKALAPWLLSDFGHKSLLTIWHLCTQCPIDEVRRCMVLVEDKHKRSTDYLMAIIEKEQAIQRERIKDKAEINAYSKRVINAFLGIINSKSTPANWSKLESNDTVDKINATEFSKVKLT